MEKEKIENAIKILVEAEKGAGEFSRDPLQHAENTIDEMKKLIREAINELNS